MIIGLCMYVIPDDEVRKIKHLRVFFITATWSVFAYVWLYLILGAISYGVVESWEGIVTFLFFPATVYTAFVADRRMFFYKYLDKKYRAQRGVIVQSEKGDIESRAQEKFADDLDDMDPALAEFERNRRAYIQAMKRIRLENRDAIRLDHGRSRLGLHHDHLPENLSLARLGRWLLAGLQHAQPRDGELTNALHLLCGDVCKALEHLLACSRFLLGRLGKCCGNARLAHGCGTLHCCLHCGGHGFQRMGGATCL